MRYQYLSRLESAGIQSRLQHLSHGKRNKDHLAYSENFLWRERPERKCIVDDPGIPSIVEIIDQIRYMISGFPPKKLETARSKIRLLEPHLVGCWCPIARSTSCSSISTKAHDSPSCLRLIARRLCGRNHSSLAPRPLC